MKRRVVGAGRARDAVSLFLPALLACVAGSYPYPPFNVNDY